MKHRGDVQKRREWAERLGRFRSSGMTVARFCASEGVAVNTFYYWSGRAGSAVHSPSPAARSASVRGSGAGDQDRAAAQRAPLETQGAAPALVHFHFPAGAKVSVPADCMAAIRCLAECVRLAQPAPAAAFQEVLVGRR
jgi:hypothetical protein